MDDFKHRIEQMGMVASWESDKLSPEESERFWRQVVDRKAPLGATPFQRLLGVGLDLPEPEALDDQQITMKTWEVIAALARMRVLISQTDHLSDRALYTLLWSDVLRQEIPLLPIDPRSTWHFDLLSGGGEEETRTYLKHYADDGERTQWMVDFPDYEMPPHEDPPFDRSHSYPRTDVTAPPLRAVARSAN